MHPFASDWPATEVAAAWRAADRPPAWTDDMSPVRAGGRPAGGAQAAISIASAKPRITPFNSQRLDKFQTRSYTSLNRLRNRLRNKANPICEMLCQRFVKL